MSVATAMWLGVVQGFTEFLPVSSSGHLVIAQHFMTDFEQPGVLFDVVLHLGTLGAVLAYFRREIRFLISGIKPGAEGEPGRRLIGLLVIGTIPAVVLALLLKDTIEQSFARLSVVGVSLCITGVWLLFSSRKAGNTRELQRVRPLDALVVGLCQSAALFPGISRSGTTIGAGLVRGLENGASARFSFLLSIPAILGAAVFNMSDVTLVSGNALSGYAAGFLTAFAIGYIAIGIVIKFLESQKFHLFGYYCLGLGGTLLVYVTYGHA